MTPEDYFRVAPVSAYAWLISYRYWITAPWGETRQELTLNVPSLLSNPDASIALGVHLWKRGIAPAITRHVRMWAYETVLWHQLPFPNMTPVDDAYGLLDGAAAPRADTPYVGFHSDHSDDMGMRRFFLPGAPASWISGRQLTRGGRDALEGWGIMLGAACSSYLIGAPMQLQLLFNELLVPSAGNITGAAFRPVKWVRGFEHTARAPEPSSGVWP